MFYGQEVFENKGNGVIHSFSTCTPKGSGAGEYTAGRGSGGNFYMNFSPHARHFGLWATAFRTFQRITG